MKLILFLVFGLTFPLIGYGADPVAAVNSATSWLNGPTVVGAIGGIAVVSEMLFRVLPSSTALSWAIFASNLCKALSGFFDAINKFLDKVIPQNLQK